MGGLISRWINSSWLDGWMSGQPSGWMDGWLGEQADEWVNWSLSGQESGFEGDGLKGG